MHQYKYGRYAGMKNICFKKCDSLGCAPLIKPKGYVKNTVQAALKYNMKKLTNNGIIRQQRARKSLNNLKYEKHFLKHSEYTTKSNGR